MVVQWTLCTRAPCIYNHEYPAIVNFYQNLICTDRSVTNQVILLSVLQLLHGVLYYCFIRFSSLYHAVRALCTCALELSIFPSDIPQPHINKLEFGYIEPGHGLKGRKEWILDDDELLEFLERCEGKKNQACIHFGAIDENPQSTSKAKGDPNDQHQSPPQLYHPISLVPHSMISILQRWLDDTHSS